MTVLKPVVEVVDHIDLVEEHIGLEGDEEGEGVELVVWRKGVVGNGSGFEGPC